MTTERRTLLLIQRRAITFLAVYASVLFATAILLIGLKTREIPCQELAHELVLPIFVSPSVDDSTLLPAVLEALARSGLNAHLNHRPVNGSIGFGGTYVSIDTPNGALKASNFQLLRQTGTDGQSQREVIRVRYVSDDLCATLAPRVLDINHNVDRDVVVSKRIAELLDSQRVFYHETVLHSMFPVVLTKFSQLENLVPSFRDLNLEHGDLLEERNEMSYSVVTNAPILSSGAEVPVSIVIEEWSTKAGRQFWKVFLRCNDPRWEALARGTQEALMARLSNWRIEASSIGAAVQY
ncbi:membrane-associated protein, putative [Bodo saltans]|uniref:Membrane-associated protein, putative n=1 Tax=Bodo saltans TaxID=75058 RepID=A0A0S4JKH0_BODSA|nr:membrane-associated protein, putative [Bodo saltans]|eukprot:CUG89680.1 membrane-associated protein, putative [Bodo saltans]